MRPNRLAKLGLPPNQTRLLGPTSRGDRRDPIAFGPGDGPDPTDRFCDERAIRWCLGGRKSLGISSGHPGATRSSRQRRALGVIGRF